MGFLGYLISSFFWNEMMCRKLFKGKNYLMSVDDIGQPSGPDVIHPWGIFGLVCGGLVGLGVVFLYSKI